MADNNDDYQVRNYQDDLDDDAKKRDKVTEDLTDDPTKELGVNPRELREEEAHYAFEDGEQDQSDDDEDSADDRREEFEDDLDDGSNQDK